MQMASGPFEDAAISTYRLPGQALGNCIMSTITKPTQGVKKRKPSNLPYPLFFSIAHFIA